MLILYETSTEQIGLVSCLLKPPPRNPTNLDLCGSRRFHVFNYCEPMCWPCSHEELGGWSESLTEVRVLGDLPEAARAYIRYLEEGARVPAFLVSVGPRRRETIVLHNPFVGRAEAP